MISFVGAVKLGFQRYFDFSGRSTRAEFWWWILFGFLATFVFTIVDNILGTNGEDGGTGLITGLWQLATLMPGLAVTVRRLHDINKSGWWLLLGFLSWLIIPFIILLVWFIRPSSDEASRFNPPLPSPDGVVSKTGMRRLNPLRALALLLAFLFLVSLYPFYMTFIDIDPRHIYLDDYATQEDWDRMAVTLGLDKPYPQQYGRFLKSVLTGDLGWAEIRLSY